VSKPKREPKHVKALIAKHTKAQPTPPPINAVHFTTASLWKKLRLRKPK
jgi:hypothetical protein